jgi:hypothetical protein
MIVPEVWNTPMIIATILIMLAYLPMSAAIKQGWSAAFGKLKRYPRCGTIIGLLWPITGPILLPCMLFYGIYVVLKEACDDLFNL